MEASKVAYCQAKQKWIEKVFRDCLCNTNDVVSFCLGMTSLVCWAVAEIPQIITNFTNKSAAGVSLAFFSTWIIGDVFNLVGCNLEPATLPTQFYTALLYTIVTIILGMQCIYYNHLLRRWNRGQKWVKCSDETEPLQPMLLDHWTASKRIPKRMDFYFMSARSLAGSAMPPSQSYIKERSVPPALEHSTDSSSEEDNGEPAPPAIAQPVTQPRPIPRPMRYGTFVAASVNFPYLSKALGLMQEHENGYGQWLGWLMAAIYMGSRIPQIWLNLHDLIPSQGLNPLMFVFALIANATYVGSILVRNTGWNVIKANMPWLLDAIVCMVLDIFIILQYIFYKYVRVNKSNCSMEHPYYIVVEAS